jgi:hypothetical protein
MAKRPKSETRQRQEHIMVRVTREEKERLRLKAAMCGCKTPSYIRRLALGYPLQSLVDQYAVDQLLQAKADLARLGGLYKLWLTKNEDFKAEAKLGKHDYEGVERLVDDLAAKEKELIEIAKTLMTSKRST